MIVLKELFFFSNLKFVFIYIYNISYKWLLVNLYSILLKITELLFENHVSWEIYICNGNRVSAYL